MSRVVVEMDMPKRAIDGECWNYKNMVCAYQSDRFPTYCNYKYKEYCPYFVSKAKMEAQDGEIAN